MRSLALSLCAAVLGALVVAPVASALIQVDRGIAGARLGNTKAQVHAALGRPAKKESGRNDFGPFLQETYRGGITVFYQGARRVTSVSTDGLGDRTAKGVGVGSTEAAVKAKVPGVTCETIVGSRSCHTHDFLPGRRVTDFLIRRGRVLRVSIGIVID
jgi:hypothetical protein